jgi:chromosome segregation ATPase
MKESISKLTTETEKKNSLIEKYEVDIRRCNDELSKKASDIDILNKKYDQITAGGDTTQMGSLEATIHSLTKSIQKRELECFQLQGFWLKIQNDMVQMSVKNNELTDQTQDLKMRLTILNRKKILADSTTFANPRLIPLRRAAD